MKKPELISRPAGSLIPLPIQGLAVGLQCRRQQATIHVLPLPTGHSSITERIPMMSQARTLLLATAAATAFASLSACSAIPEDIRATLPEGMRGDVKALADYPTPDLIGNWKDQDFPELAISMSQNGKNFSFRRSGSYREIPVDGTYTGTLNGREVKISYKEKHPGKIRPVDGQCFGVASKDSTELKLTCDDPDKGSYPMILRKS